jgi:hypothetical protein
MSRKLGPLAALAMVALIGAGCSNDPAENGGAGNTSADYENAVKFSECLRDNGVSEFPDPDASGSLHELGADADAGVGVDPDDNDFTWETEEALEELQDDKGLNETGALDVDDAVFLPESARIAKVTGELGGSASPGARVAQATSDTLEVQVELEASQQGVVKEGDRAEITLPGNKSVKGKVDRLGRVAQAPAGQDDDVGDATIPASISLDKPRQASGLDKAPVQVDITTEGVKSALSVPVTALVGNSGGGFAFEVVREGGRGELVAVKLGLFDTASGRVEVERDGDRANDGRSEAVGEQLVAGTGGDDLAVADDEALPRVGSSQPSRRPGSKNNLLRNYN